jgi:HEAT repeat protein
MVVLCLGLACTPPVAEKARSVGAGTAVVVLPPKGDSPTPAAPAGWKPPPPPDALLAELRGASAERRGQIIEVLASEQGGAALVTAILPFFAAPPEQRWSWVRRIFDAVDRCADPRAADALAAFADKLGPVATGAKGQFDGEQSSRAYGRTRAGFALAELGDLRALPLLIERLSLDPRVVHSAERFWEADAGGHLSRSDDLRVAAARLASEVFDANKSGPSHSWADADRAVLAWVDSKPAPHTNAMRFFARVRSDKDLGALRKWAFPSDPLPKSGAQPPFPVAFEVAQSALAQLGASRAVEVGKLVPQLQRKPKQFDGSMEALISGGNAMRGMALRALGVGASNGLGALGDKSATAALWQVALDPLTNEEVRMSACDALGTLGEEASLRVVLDEAVRRAGGDTAADAFAIDCAVSALGRAAQPALAADVIGLLERGGDKRLLSGTAQALWSLELGDKEQQRLITLLTRPSPSPHAFAALLWATSYDPKALVSHRSKLTTPEREALDLVLLDVGSGMRHGPGAPLVLARWAARARAFDQAAARSIAGDGLRRAFDLVGLEHTSGFTRAGLRRELLALARGNQAGAVWALAAGSERGPLLALASGGDGVPPASVEAARAALSLTSSRDPAR